MGSILMSIKRRSVHHFAKDLGIDHVWRHDRPAVVDGGVDQVNRQITREIVFV